MGGKVNLMLPSSRSGSGSGSGTTGQASKAEPFSVAVLTWLETYADGNALKCFCGKEPGTLGETVFFAGRSNSA
jgi:hypothetical protein